MSAGSKHKAFTITEGGLFRCTWPGCGYEHEQPGAVQLHYHQKHIRPQGNGAAAAARRDDLAEKRRQKLGLPKPAAKPEPGRCRECGGVLRLLRRSVPGEGDAMSDGFKAVCVECALLHE